MSIYLPVAPLDWRERLALYCEIIEGWAESRTQRFSILEVGVFRGDLSQKIHEHFAGRIDRFVGVDPFLGTPDDAYFAGYWNKDQNVAEEQFIRTNVIFQNLGATLLRLTSDSYFDKSEDKFDVIIIDGDHRRFQCEKDLIASLTKLKSGGLLMCDDYANPDHPGVTEAVLAFDRAHSGSFSAAGLRFIFFNNEARRMPFPLGVAYWRYNN